MSVVACPSEPVALQRARGLARAAFGHRDGATHLSGLRQEGCLKLRFPRPDRAGIPEAALINISGGIAAGDLLSVEIDAGAGSHITLTTQAAERVYRASPGAGAAAVTTRLEIGAGATLDWLPQEMILFDGARLERRLHIAMAADARFTGIETLVFGRDAMGETVRHGSLDDRITIARDGVRLLHDAIRLRGDIAATLARPAVAGGARVIATLLHVATDAARHLAPLRAALEAALAGTGADAGASVRDGLIFARIIAPDTRCARAAILAGLSVLRGTSHPPRVWLC